MTPCPLTRTSYTLPYNTNDDSRAVIGGSGTDFGVCSCPQSGDHVVDRSSSLEGDTTSKDVVFGQAVYQRVRAEPVLHSHQPT
jgi:hypothetical protein